MTKNPIYNAVGASVYIAFVVLLINLASQVNTSSKPSSYFVGFMMVSLFTLSAAIMAYLFGYNPGKLYFEGKREEAVKLFLKTVVAFACITLFWFMLYFVGIIA